MLKLSSRSVISRGALMLCDSAPSTLRSDILDVLHIGRWGCGALQGLEHLIDGAKRVAAQDHVGRLPRGPHLGHGIGEIALDRLDQLIQVLCCNISVWRGKGQNMLEEQSGHSDLVEIALFAHGEHQVYSPALT